MGLDEPHTQITEAESEALARCCATANCVVEIGCFEGRTTVILARGTSGTVYSIDPFFPGSFGIRYNKLIAATHARRNKLHNIHFEQGFSYDVAPGFDQAIDLLFIDGDHSLAGVERDWADWFPKVRLGGMIALHDSIAPPDSPERFGSMDFYETRLLQMPQIELIESVDSLAIFRKTSNPLAAPDPIMH